LVTPNAAQYDVEVFMKQKLKGRTAYGQNNRVPIQFFNDDFQRLDTVITFSGISGSQTFTIPFMPTEIICDIDEQISDATTDLYYMVKAPELINVSTSFFKTDISAAPDSSLLRVEHNWVAPDDFLVGQEGLEIHPERYWKIGGVWNSGFQANGQFYYSRVSTSYMDRDFITTHVDSLVVLFRSRTNEDWQIVPHVRSGSTFSGYLVIDNLQKGEYALGLWDHHVGLNTIEKDSGLKVYPNPTNSELHVELTKETIHTVSLYNMSGQMVKQVVIEDKTNATEISIEDLPVGMYMIELDSEYKKYSKKILKK
jgi:hypothetical protein